MTTQEEMYGPIWKPFSNAWDRLWDEVQQHPEIIGCRETHVHVLLGHHLLQELEQSPDLKPYEGCEIRFDDPSGLNLPGYTTWSLIGSAIRPDITVRPKKDGQYSGRGLAIELKCLRTTLFGKEMGDESLIAKHNFYQEKDGIKADLARLADFVQVGSEDAGFRGIMCVLHLHEKRFGDMPEIADMTWGGTVQIDGCGYVVRRATAVVTPAYDPGSTEGLFDDKPPSVEWLQGDTNG